MTKRITSALAAIFWVFGVASAAAQAPRASVSQEFHSRVRLISGVRQDHTWQAGIEIVLDSGYKTYWRNPGESGLPPRFDWSESSNVAKAEVKWPAPARHEDAGGVTYVYERRIVLPMLVTVTDPARPTELTLTVDYGICKEICIPAHATLKATLAGDGRPNAAIDEALARVPRPQRLGVEGELSIASFQPSDQSRMVFEALIKAPAGTTPALFAEAPDGWYLSTSRPGADNRILVTIDEKPRDASGPVPVRLTLVAGDKAVETEVSLDAGEVSR